MSNFRLIPLDRIIYTIYMQVQQEKLWKSSEKQGHI